MCNGKSQPENLHEREVDLSNVTLHTLFGAARQKSWMLVGGTPVRPTPRSSLTAKTSSSLPSPNLDPQPKVPSSVTRAARPVITTEPGKEPQTIIDVDKNPKKLNSNEKLTRASCADEYQKNVAIENNLIAPRPEPPRTISPPRQETYSEPIRKLLREAARDLLSESSIEKSKEQSIEQLEDPPTRPSIEIPPQPHEDLRTTQPSKELPTEPLEDPPTQLSIELPSQPPEDLPTTQPSKELPTQLPVERCLTTTSEIIRPVEGNTHASSRSQTYSAEAQKVVQPELSVTVTLMSNITDDPTLTQTDSRNVQHPSQSPLAACTVNNEVNQTPSLASTTQLSPFVTPEESSQVLHLRHESFEANSGSNSESTALPPTQNVTFSLKSKLTMIETQLRSVGGLESLNTGLERPRFYLLIEACKIEDLFYVVLHQLYILWDFRREDVLRLQESSNIVFLQTGFKIIARIIHENNQLAPNHKRWFADFPCPISTLWHTSEYCRKICVNVLSCIEKFSQNWYGMIQESRTRNAPFLVEEIVRKLGVQSPTFQRVLFTASRRNLGIQDEETNNAMNEVFKVDQAEFLQLSEQNITGLPTSVKERRDRNNALVQTYSNLFIQYQRSCSGSMSDTSRYSVPQAVNSPNNISSSNLRSPSTVIGSRSQGSPHISQPYGVPRPNVLESTNQRQHTSWAPQGNANSSNYLSSQKDVGPNQNYLHRSSMDLPHQGSSQLTSSLSNPNDSRNLNNVRQRIFVTTPTLGSTQYQSNNFPPPQLMTRHPIQLQGSSPSVGNWQNLGIQHQQHYPPYPMHAQPSQQAHQVYQLHQNQLHQNQLNQNQLHQNQSQQNQLQQNQLQQNQSQQNQSQQHQYRPRRGQFHVQTQQRQQQPVFNRSRLVSQENLPLNRPNLMRSVPAEAQQSVPSRSISSVPSSVGMQLQTTPRNSNIGNNGSRASASLSNMPSYTNAVVARSASFTPPRPNKIKDDISIYYQTGILNRSIVPPHHWVHSPDTFGINRPELNALHQALLRSPRLVPITFSPTEKQNEQTLRYYQAVKHFALPPRIIPDCCISEFEFSVSDSDIIKIPLDSIAYKGNVPIRKFQEGTLQYRLRCVEISKLETSIPENEWIIKDTAWPEIICLDINGRHLEIRRKKHHGKDLPIDITQHVLKNGIESPNKITLSIIRGQNKLMEHNYFLAVEVTEIMEHSQILHMCQKTNRLEVSHTLDMIKKSLAPSSLNKDDDFEIVISEISIDLADPFTSCIFQIPARGRFCLHRECFDLETFLLTRNSRPNRTDQPCIVDVWKCPLCGGDARPWQLQIDGFLELIRKELAEQGNLETVKSIRVEPDGSWHPKLEKRKSFTDSRDFFRNIDFSTHQKSNSKKPIEVIDLDDDS
ncbi:hypothetical protein GcC1_047001 [Golovinomyces cichoracearum]|uniref:SP-RING-type domain-containing protein n=1 Tax=Golovinomyces cichoracearum TaxID=62708 RepID=A0A420IXU4_9PEZI|nr:hypothetical protein GcC1_047001 [Golovinomyces cichoracearum]